MSDLYDKRIRGSELNAPPGMYRIVRAIYRDKRHLQVRRYHYVGDYPDAPAALLDASVLRTLDPQMRANVDLLVIDSEGHEVSERGVRIEEYELVAPRGRFRIVTFDEGPLNFKGFRTIVYWKRYDVLGRARAIHFTDIQPLDPQADSVVFDDRGEMLGW